MKALLRRLDRFPYDHPNFGIPNLMRWVVLANVVVYLLDIVTQGACSYWLGFYPALVLRGQIWRLVTFIVVPESYGTSGLGPLWFVFAMFFYYYLGTAIEQSWGSARFSLFYLSGILLTLAAGFLAFGLSSLLWRDASAVFSWYPITMSQVNFSILLTFATLFPDTQFRVYFVIPIKAKWLALFYLALRVWSYMRLSGVALLVYLPFLLPQDLSAIANYLLFCHDEVAAIFRHLTYKRQRKADPHTINFKKAQKDIRDRKGYLHKCAVCGITDADDPTMEFRYCSKCNGYYCYCMNHINNHTHVQ
jgi:membrane associated rhomboid family serine protease